MAHTQLHLQAGTLLGIVKERPGVAEWRVRLTDGSEAQAIAYPALAGHLLPGRTVWVNTTAVELGLGTGGCHFILSPCGEQDLAGSLEIGQTPERTAGHLMKLRYTPLQHAVLATEEAALPGAGESLQEIDLDGLPILAAELHSAAMTAAIAARACGMRRVVYVMADGAALPLALSTLVSHLRSEGILAGTITTGQAFGGDLEAVTVASALAAARAVLDADLVVVAQGPGSAGTGTCLGFSGLAQAEHLNTAAVLGGRPVAALRVSFADSRPRHQCLSHHSVTVLGRMTLARTSVAVPVLGGDEDGALLEAIQRAGLSRRHVLRQVLADDLLEALDPYRDTLTTMGRTIGEDRPFFLAACAAARLAADPASGSAWQDAA
jgi:Protein of unknown function (DUF3866)